MFTGIRLHSQFLRNLAEKNEEEITDSFIKNINYPNDLGLYLGALEFCILNKITYSAEIIKGVINLSNFLLLDHSIHKKLLDYKYNITININDEEYYINDLKDLDYIINYSSRFNIMVIGYFDGCYRKTLINKLSYLGLVDILIFIENEYNDLEDKYYYESIKYAALNGQIETIKFLKEEYDAPIDSGAISFAAENGHIETIKFLKEEYNAPICINAILCAALNGHIETIKLLKEEYNAPLNRNAITHAAKNGHIETVKFLKEKYNLEMRDSIILGAIENGHIETVKFLIEEYNIPINKYAIRCAAENGYIEIVKMLKEKYNYPIDKWAISRAEENGHIEIVELLKNYLKIIQKI